MAHKATAFSVNQKKKIITIYTNIEMNPAEKGVYEFYLANGYTPVFCEKKDGITVKVMRDTLKNDKKALDEFNDIYKSKDKDKGFFGACKYFNEWKKANKIK